MIPDAKSRSRFLEDGFCCARDPQPSLNGLQVVAEYSEQLEATGLWGRFWLRLMIEREVRVRLNQVAPPIRTIDCQTATQQRYVILEARMPHEKTIGKPDAGNPHVRFERGPQETEPVRHRA